MTPLRIEWTFATPIVVNNNYPIHLDALVAYSVFEEAQELGAPNAVELSGELGHIFDCVGHGDQKVWMASALKFTAASEALSESTLVRRCEAEAQSMAFDKGLIGGRPRRAVDSTRGAERAYFVNYQYQIMRKAQAWCMGDADELQGALARIKFIGKKGSNGFGRVSSMSIVEDVDARSKWRVRNLPIGVQGAEGVAYIKSQQCLRPPYWDRTQFVVAQEPVIL